MAAARVQSEMPSVQAVVLKRARSKRIDLFYYTFCLSQSSFSLSAYPAQAPWRIAQAPTTCIFAARAGV